MRTPPSSRRARWRSPAALSGRELADREAAGLLEDLIDQVGAGRLQARQAREPLQVGEVPEREADLVEGRLVAGHRGLTIVAWARQQTVRSPPRD